MEVKYQKPQPGDFFFTVNQRVNDYFTKNNISKKTNAFGVFKAFFFIAAFVGLYYLVMTANGNALQILPAFALIGFVQICLVLNLGHEGVHNSFSNSHKLNYIIAFTFDLLGSSGYLWKMRHVYSHHPYPMIPEHDVDIQQSNMFTFVPMKEPNKVFRFQKFYVPLLYCFYSLNAIFKRDWEDFFSYKIGHKNVKHPKSEVFRFLVTKVIYFTYALIIPLLFSGSGWGLVLLGFFFMHVIASLSAAVALFPAHLYEESIFPRSDDKGEMSNSWAEHQMSVTMDFGTRWPLVAFFFGGINYHVVHHLFPTVCHVHFPKIHKILEKTADEFNIPYRHMPSLNMAIVSHWVLLKKNGVAELNEVF
jgi:linoleoyl-CoA desaturase